MQRTDQISVSQNKDPSDGLDLQEHEEQNIADSSQRNSQAYQLSQDELEEYIIVAVQNEPCLWNPRIPVEERTKLKKQQAWASIKAQLNDRYSVADIEKNWTDLRSKYISVRSQSRSYRPSGSAEISPAVEMSIKHEFKHYDLMEFINDTSDPVR